MGEVIKRSDVIEALGEEPEVWNDEDWEIAARNQWRDDVAAVLSVKAVQPEIIKCEECMYCDKEVHLRYCRLHNCHVYYDDFCSRAERRPKWLR